MIPITTVAFGPEEEQLVLDVLRSGAVAQGPKVKEFEDRFAEMFGAKHAVAVNNGTTALIASLEVLDLQPGDEVITTPFTFVATINAILQAGATVRFADIGYDDFNIDPTSVAQQITDRTRVIAPVHLYGQMADMDPIMALAQANDVMVLEDSAQSHGASYKGKYAGTFGMGTFSFYATKNITTGEGGMITTDSDELADKLRTLRNQGMKARYVYEMAGNNYRLTDLQAVLALPQLSRYSETVARRQANAAKLSAGLAGIRGLVTPVQLEGREHVWHQYTVRVTDDAPISRDEFVARLGEAGIGCGVYYPKLIHDYDAYRSDPRVLRSDVPVASEVVRQVASIPVHTALTDADIATIVDTINNVLGAQA
jgi:perosamine synthetase